MSTEVKSRLVASTLAAVTLLAVSGASDAAAQGRLVKKGLNPFDAAALERARAGAARRLYDPQCLKVLTDFRDGAGQTLDRALEAWRMSAADYLQVVRFEDGSLSPACDRPSVLLRTAPGLPWVYVCPGGPGKPHSRFAEVELHNPALAEAMIIHEMLHTLGLGENPPSTFEITERVRQRCR
jgi:hypothetical protein